MTRPPLRITGADRVMVLAVHPDDESLATGGLLQRAGGVGAAIRVVFITDGENNPWPQRALERRWWLGPADRARWGQRRRAEALAALGVLGVEAGCARFLGWPDQGLTALLLGDRAGMASETLARHIRTWRPTLLFVPSLRDRHPDHSALAVLVRLALHRLGATDHRLPPTVLHYLVHGQEPPHANTAVTLPLFVWEKRNKAAAIARHASQLLLSRQRFLAYATDEERFGFSGPHESDVSHTPRHRGTFRESSPALEWTLEKPLRAFQRPALHVVFASQLDGRGITAWTVPVRRAADIAPVLRAHDGVPIGEAMVRVERRRVLVHLPIGLRAPGRQVFVKLQRHGGAFLDLGGWQELSPPLAVLRSTRAQAALPSTQAAGTLRHLASGQRRLLSASYPHGERRNANGA